MVNSKFKISKILKFWVQVEFYSLACLVIAKFVLHKEISFEDTVRSLFPLTGEIYWFASAYAVLIGLSPLLNKFIHSMNKNEHFLTCILLCIIFCIIPTFCFWSRGMGYFLSGFSFSWFVVLYVIAAYIRLYCSEIYFLKLSKNKYLALYFVLSVFAVLSRLIIGKVESIIWGKIIYEGIFYSYNSIIIFAASVCLFMFFRTLEIKNKISQKIAVGLGGVCFGAYLCSDNPFLRKPLWDFVNLPNMVNKGIGGVLIGVISAVILIFIGGCVIEWIRKKFFEILKTQKLLTKIDDMSEKITCFILSKYDKKRI